MVAWRWIAAGIGTAVAGGAVLLYRNENAAEQPGYATLDSEDDLNLRLYRPMLVAELTLTGNRENALARGFQRLADYINAKERGGDKIAMTAPVLQEAADANAVNAPPGKPEHNFGIGKWRIRFVMPWAHTRETLPAPPADISIEDVPSRRMAAIRFSGAGTDAQLHEQTSKLRRWMADKKLQAMGEPEYAFYNSPFMPPFLRRNEVLIETAAP